MYLIPNMGFHCLTFIGRTWDQYIQWVVLICVVRMLWIVLVFSVIVYLLLVCIGNTTRMNIVSMHIFLGYTIPLAYSAGRITPTRIAQFSLNVWLVKEYCQFGWGARGIWLTWSNNVRPKPLRPKKYNYNLLIEAIKPQGWLVNPFIVITVVVPSSVPIRSIQLLESTTISH
jgi:hypothetical protein